MTDKDYLDPINTNKLFELKDTFLELVSIYENNKLPKVLLFSGTKGIGKYTLVMHFINYIFDKKNYDLQNNIILKDSLFNQNLRKNLLSSVINLQNVDYNQIKIDSIRGLKNQIQKTNLNDGNRFIILDEIELLNQNAANALLKIIEEPGEKNFFFLIDNQQNKLIDTISSRCLSKKIFLNKIKKLNVINSLIKKHNIEQKLAYNKLDISPGLYLKYNNIFLEESIDENLNYYSKIEKMLSLYKKTKNKIYIKITIFLTEQYFYDLCLEKDNEVYNLNIIKIKILKHINDFLTLNLSTSSVINIIKSQFNYE
ncbi:MAG: hypothetical protein ACJZ69_02780 [Pelagibacteraceae bacterium]